jgi:hypothetical protein
MTVDLDLLADYVEGVLDPDEQARVISFVQHDPEWASAHDALVAALPSVATALASVTPEPMPTSVLAATLESFAAERAANALETEPDRSATGAHKRDDTRPVGGRPPTAGTKRARRRELRGAVLAAFALVLVVSLGLGYLAHNNTQSAKSPATDGKAAAPQFAGGAASGGKPLIVASGRDYTQPTLPYAYGAQNPPAATPPVRTPDSIVPGPEITSASLDRLRMPDALDACLAGVTATVGGTPMLVDYARFQGVPALIVTIADPRTVLAVGADCGLPGHGIDELARS